MPVLSVKKLEMADIDNLHDLTLSQQVSTHMIRQKNALSMQNPTRHIQKHAVLLLLVTQGGV